MRVVRQIVRSSVRVLGQFQPISQRVSILFVGTVLATSICLPPAAALATTIASAAPATSGSIKNHTVADPHAKAANPNFIAANQNLGSGQAPVSPIGSSYAAATDATMAVGPSLDGSTPTQGSVNVQPLTNPEDTQQAFQLHELTDLRTANSSSFVHNDGTITQTNYMSPKFFQSSGSWQPIDTTLIPDTNANDADNFFTQALATIQSWFAKPNAYEVTANSWMARFAPSNFGAGMFRIKEGDSQVAFKPVNANDVNPVVSATSTGLQKVSYPNIWQGVDLEYLVLSDEVKEAIIIKDKTAAAQIQFTVTGAGLQKPTTPNNDGNTPAFNITDALDNQFSIAPADLILTGQGMIANSTSGLTQDFTNGVYTVGISNNYLQNLSASSFPAVIDPSAYVSYFGDRSGGHYVSLKSDGYICPSTQCNLYSGALNDGGTKYWRGAFFSGYDVLKPSGVILDSATLHLTQLTGVSWWTGDTASHTFQIDHATCLTSYNGCYETTHQASGTVSTSGNITVTSLYQDRVNANDWGGYMMVRGEDGTTTSYKEFDPDNSYVTFTYHSTLAAPTVVAPVTDQVYTDPQASFKVNLENNPNNSTPLQYEMIVSNAGGANGGGIAIDSGLQRSPLFTVPDGVLQDGSTYYLRVRSWDSSINIYSSWTTPIRFRIDTRQGKDKTQTYDSVGPASIDLATGNVSTGTASHTTKALGGDLGVTLDYNSSLRSRPGLVGSYWNGNTTSGTPALVRVDQNVDFDWNSGSPSVGVNATNFTTQWNGYFVAPLTGSYYFGAVNDDNITIKVNTQQLYSGGICTGPVPCYGSSISLTAGQVVPFQATYYQSTSSDYVHLFVKGPVPSQAIPQQWLQTGVRPVQQSNGLIGHYYAYNDTGVPPTIPSDNTGLFLTRTDPSLSFDWNSDSVIPNGPKSSFMARWSGYLSVPASGNYRFGAYSDDGTRIKITINGTANTVYDHWQDGAVEGYDPTGVTLNTGQVYPITVDYYQHLVGDKFYLKVYPLGSSNSEIVPSSWLIPAAQILPNGWGLGVDPDGNATYTSLTANQNDVILTDSSGDTHDYTWTGTGYKAPTNEYGHLVRSLDGNFTLQDSDGRTYTFDSSGTLTSLTNPSDDTHPAALQYTYSSVYSGGPVEIQQITDSVDPSRYAQVYYSGATQCGTAPSGFATAPANMVCALITNDGRATYFYYDGTGTGNLTRVSRPGGDNTDYQYQPVFDTSLQTIGYQLIGIRNSLGNDAVVAGIRANDNTTFTSISYDAIGRATQVMLPAANNGDARLTKSYNYFTAFAPAPLNRYYKSPTDHAAFIAPVPLGYHLESTLGYLPMTQMSGTTALYSCLTNSTDEFTSTSSNCESRPFYFGLLGYIYTAAPSGLPSVAIYRCRVTSSGEHFDSQSSSCEGQSLDFRLGYLLTNQPTLASAYTEMHIAGAAEPNGYSEHVEYDSLFRTTKDTGVDGNSTTTVWDANKDLPYETTGPTGLMSSTIYDDDDRPITQYGPAPSSWFTSSTNASTGHIDYVPQSAYASQVPRSDTSYDQGLTGLAAAYFNVNEPSANNASLIGAPRLHATNIASDGTISNNWGTGSPISGVSSNWGFSLTGKMRLPASGAWTFNVTSDNGVRIWIDNVLVTDDWKDHPSGTIHPAYVYTNTANTLHDVRIDYYHLSGTAAFTLYMTPPGGSQTTNVAQYFSPDYSLPTSSTLYDSTIGNTTATTNYGSNPELGLAQSATVDPSGLSLTSTSTYETQGASGSFLRQTSAALPGSPSNDPTFSYSYYGATETRQNPCNSSQTFKQAGMLKFKTEASPDGGTTPGRVTEYVYDDAGNVVASRISSDDWTCTTYDSRGRVSTVTVPAFNGAAAHTISYDYAVNGNPLMSIAQDAAEQTTWTQTTIDLLGRTVSYQDVHGDVTTTTYDNLGRLSQTVSPVGTEVFNYDNYNRLTSEVLDGTTYAQVYYDQYSRIDHVTYPNAGSMQATPGRDGLQRANSLTYLLGDGTTSISDTTNLTQSNRVSSDTVQSGANSLTSAYAYDAAGRLTAATVGTHSYAYGFGAQDSSCGSGSNMNANAGKDGNRTSQTIDGVTTTYCYDYADRLVSSSDSSANGAQYDSHGNTTLLGTNSAPLHLYYDSLDRNMGIENYDGSGNGSAIYYDCDASGRLTYREHDAISAFTWNLDAQYWYGYTGSGDCPDFIRDSNWNVVEKDLQLPGGVLLVIHPQQSGNAQKQYTLPSALGRTLLTTDASGTNTSTGTGPLNSFAYDPFGNAIGSLPSNAGNGSYGFGGSLQKMTETTLALMPIQMGARVYFPTLGRFASVDPVDGGTPNRYSYVLDPVNGNDYTGEFGLFGFSPWQSKFDAYSAWTSYQFGKYICGGWWMVACIADAAMFFMGGGPIDGILAARAGRAIEAMRILRGEGAARNLAEELTLKTVRANPRIGTEIMKDLIKDPAYKRALGWRKMQYTHQGSGYKIVVHYFYNIYTKAVSQLKIK